MECLRSVRCQWQGCRRRFYLCRACDHGQRYCQQECSQRGRRARQRRAQRRYACNGRLRDACYHWARVATQRDAATKAHCAALRERGHSYGRALRSVVDRLLRIYLAMLAQNIPYDPSRPRGATRAPPLPSGAPPDNLAPLPPPPAALKDEPT